MAEVSIQIARSAPNPDLPENNWEVRVIGPGGWRTSIGRASLSACRSDARAWAQVLGVEVREVDR